MGWFLVKTKVNYVICQRSGYMKISVDSCVFRFVNWNLCFYEGITVLHSGFGSVQLALSCDHFCTCVLQHRECNFEFYPLSFLETDHFTNLCVCVCVCERERERERETGLRVHPSDGNDLCVIIVQSGDHTCVSAEETQYWQENGSYNIPLL